MKKITTFFCFFIFAGQVIATEQVPDILWFDSLKLTLETGWGHPSPLETYFHQNKMKYPFKMLSTGNYRGHIATWVIQNNRLYLKEIQINSKKYFPRKFGIKSKTHSPSAPDNVIFADWFDGIIACDKIDLKNRWKILSTYYFQIRSGKIIAQGEFVRKNSDEIELIPEEDSTDFGWIEKNKLKKLNENYITYYYRLNEGDLIQFNNLECRLHTSYSKLSPIYTYFSNLHLKWPYNWENLEKCGAPNCKWIILNDSLMLTEVQLYSGLRFDSINKEIIRLDLLFPGNVINNSVFASWVTGVHLIMYGSDTTYSSGFKEFTPIEYIFCKFEQGIVKEKYTVSSNYYLKGSNVKISPKVKKLIKEY